MTRAPRIFKGPAAAYEGPGECIREVSCGDGTGALISVRAREGRSPAIQVYRVDPGVRVSVGFDDGYDPVRELLGALRVLVNGLRTDADWRAAREAIAKAEART